MPPKSTVQNLLARPELVGLARKKTKAYDQLTVKLKDLDEYLSDGWKVARKRKSSATIRRQKKHDVLLEDRIWSLLWRMDFPELSGGGGAHLSTKSGSELTVKNQIDV